MTASRPRVLMLGLALDYQGGIPEIERLILEHWPADWGEVKFLATSVGEVGGAKGPKLLAVGKALMLFPWLMLSSRPDLVYAHFSARASFYRKALFVILAKLFRKPVVLHSNAPDFDDFFDQKAGRSRQRFIAWVLNLADELIVVSESWREYFSKIYTRRSPIVIYNPTRCATQRAVPEQAEPVVLMLGRLGSRKGTYDLLSAIPLVLRDHPHAEFWLGGDGDVDEVGRLLRDVAWGDRVRLLGWVQGAAKEKALMAAAVLVLPTYAEGLPLVILEAMAYGLPVVSTPVGGIPETVVDGETGYLVAPGAIPDLAERLSRLLGDPSMRARMGRAGRSLVERKFEVGAMLQRLVAVFGELISDPRETR